MNYDFQSIAAIVVVMTAVAVVVYFTFIKKKTGCDGCGFTGKKSSFSAKSTKSKK